MKKIITNDGDPTQPKAMKTSLFDITLEKSEFTSGLVFELEFARNRFINRREALKYLHKRFETAQYETEMVAFNVQQSQRIIALTEAKKRARKRMKKHLRKAKDLWDKHDRNNAKYDYELSTMNAADGNDN